ncbi:MAG: Alpha-amylase [Methanoculleus marisnigri]|uniref:Alpha-amylase n=1 Tax=Methanoculleus marisnigri TaxID=2198 RepID=A0A101GRB0_9EURY|nr:MAG: Alpha-amylase [Methanoculleus marisnigri]
MTDEGSNPPAVCLGFDIHYPCSLNPRFQPDVVKGKRNAKESYFNPDAKEDLGRVIDRSFTPTTEILLDLLDDGLKCAVSISGVVVERLEQWYPEMLELLSRAATHRNAEVLAGTYYHSVAGRFSDLTEFVDEVRMHRDLMKEHFSVTPTTFAHTDYPITPATAEAGLSRPTGTRGGSPPLPATASRSSSTTASSGTSSAPRRASWSSCVRSRPPSPRRG